MTGVQKVTFTQQSDEILRKKKRATLSIEYGELYSWFAGRIKLYNLQSTLVSVGWFVSNS